MIRAHRVNLGWQRATYLTHQQIARQGLATPIGEACVDLVSRILLGALQLAVASEGRQSRLRVPPLPTLLTTALGAMVPETLIVLAARALRADAPPGALAQVAAAIDEAALRITGAHPRLERAGEALDSLLVLYGLIQEPTLHEASVQLGSPELFAYLASIVVSRPGERPLMVLIGSGSVSEERLEIPLGGGELLEKLRMAYVAGESQPRWLTELWVRRPPDPLRRRLGEWSRLEGAGDAPTTLEIYRRQLPGEGPVGLITTEPVELPHRLASASLDLNFDLRNTQVRVMRTTISDKYQAPMLIAERVLTIA